MLPLPTRLERPASGQLTPSLPPACLSAAGRERLGCFGHSFDQGLEPSVAFTALGGGWGKVQKQFAGSFRQYPATLSWAPSWALLSHRLGKGSSFRNRILRFSLEGEGAGGELSGPRQVVNPGSDYTFPEFGGEGERGSARHPLEDPSDFVEETRAAGILETLRGSRGHVSSLSRPPAARRSAGVPVPQWVRDVTS